MSADLTYYDPAHFQGWQVVFGSIDLCPAVLWTETQVAQSVDLNGGDRGSLRQSIPTVPGQTYVLRFTMAGNPEGLPVVKRMRVLWNGAWLTTLRFDTTGHSDAEMGWTFHRAS